MKTIKTLLLVIAGILFLMLSGCKTEGCTDPLALNYDADAKEGGVCMYKEGCKDPFAINYDADAIEDGDCTYPNLSLMFHQKVGDSDMTIGEVYTINDYDVKFSISQFYVSGLMIMDDDGNGYPIEEDGKPKHLLVKAGQMMYDLGNVRAGHFHMLNFNVGVDATTNDQDEIDFAAWPSGHPLAAQTPAMHWSWNSGYIFYKIEGRIDFNKDGQFDGDDKDLVYHVGLDANAAPVSLMAHTDIDEASEQLMIKFDLEKVFDGFDFSDEANLETHTMNKPVVAAALKANMSTAFSTGH